MRINEIGAPLITPPELRPEVEAPRPARPVEPITPEAREEGERRLPNPRPGELPEPAPAPVERRQGDRRIEDRRKRQIPVLIDTRVADRRTSRRREDDPPAPAVDIEA